MPSPLVTPRLERLLANRVELKTQLDERCARLLKRLRDECPGAVPTAAVKPGMLSDPIAVKADELVALLRAALEQDASGDGALVLVDGESELMVDPARSRIIARDGLVLVVLGVECDQTGPVEVTVPFGVGAKDGEAGVIATTERVPRGDAIVVGRWGEALVALAWEALLSILAGLTRHAGTDLDAAPLIPAAVDAQRGSITVVPQARHEADRTG